MRKEFTMKKFRTVLALLLALFLLLFWCNPRRIFPSVSIPPDLQ